jgi:hypothetical protein
MSLLAATVLGLGLGVKHAIEADHVAAVCTFVARGGDVARAAKCGAIWGAGHGAVIVLGGSVIVASGASVPSSVAVILELAVAATLIALGAFTIASRRRPSHEGAHSHRRPFAVGLLHGASGTAALSLVLATSMQARLHALAFVAVFGIASIVGMTVVAALVAWPLRKVVQRAPALGASLRGVAGAASIVTGVLLAYATILAAPSS